MTRDRSDRCPGVFRPWIADDGAIVRLRLIGGAIPTDALRGLVDVAERWGDGTVLLTKRTNLQLRGIEHGAGPGRIQESDAVPAGLVDAITELGLLPSPSHELVRNVMTSPLTGRLGGLADLRPVARDLDARLCADPALAALAGRFLFVLDDGRGDVVDRPLDLGLVAISAVGAQLRVGSDLWGPVLPLNHAAETLVALARRFVDVHGSAWHVDELPQRGRELVDDPTDRHVLTRVGSEPPHHGVLAQDDGRTCEHVAVEDGVLTREVAEPLLDRAADEVVVTPWRSLLLTDLYPSGLETP